MLATALALALAGAPQGAGSLEAWLADLESRTAARRAHAAEVWSAQGPAWLAGDDGRLALLLEAAPEIQAPVLDTLEKALAVDTRADAYPKLLDLLGRSMNPAGAERVFRLIDVLPADARTHAVRAAIARGGADLWSAARQLSAGAPSPLRQAALQALIEHGPAAEAAALAAQLSPREGESAGLGALLTALAARELPPGFDLPPAVYAEADAGLQRDLARFLAAHPLPAAESFLVERALDPARPREERALFLTAFAAGVPVHRWRDGTRMLDQYLDGAPRSEASEDVAWTLLALGSKDAKRFLLEEVEREARENPASIRSLLELAHRQVDVGDHADAFKNFKKAFESVQGTGFERSLTGRDYVWAARAAAGSRHSKEAGQWLESSGLNPVELEAYRSLPEFASFLDKQPFKRLFGL